MKKSHFNALFFIFFFSIQYLASSHLIFLNEPSFVEFNGYFRSRFAKTSDEPLEVQKRNYDVLSYDLYLDWYNALKNPQSMDSTDIVWFGSNTILLKAEVENLSSVVLDAASLLIDSVLVNDNGIWRKVLPTPKIVAQKLTVPLPRSLNIGDSISIKVFYTYNRFVDESQYRGFYLYPKGKFVGRLPAPFYDSVFVEERLAYTMSEPEDARYWMPCNDAPYDKADAKITVRVPSGYVVASNGFLSKVQAEADTAIVYFWVSDKPITTYLMAATASKFHKYSDWYKKVTNPLDSIEIQYYVWEKDFKATKTDGSEYNATNTFKTTPEMVKFFSQIFVEYPFVKYGMVALMPFNFGGMEHQTITSINRVWLRQNTQFGIAHELAHQWIGDLVTCATWKDIWFNEGGATWSEALYAEKLWGENGYNAFLLSSRSAYLKKGGISLPPIYDLPVNTIFGDYAILVYQKASWFYHMLKEMLGDSLFFKTFRSFLQDYSFKSVTTEDIKNYFKNKISNPQVDFDTFFDQWLYKAGHPVYTLSSIVHSYTNDSGYFDAKIILSQVQTGNNVPEIFVTPVKIIFKAGDSTYSQVFLNNSKFQVFETSLPFFPDSVCIDTTFVLCEVGDIVLTASEERSLEEFKVYPNPLGSSLGLNVLVALPKSGYFVLEIYDVLGNHVYRKELGYLGRGENQFSIFDIPNLSTGVYQINLKTEGRTYKSHFIKVPADAIGQ